MTRHDLRPLGVLLAVAVALTTEGGAHGQGRSMVPTAPRDARPAGQMPPAAAAVGTGIISGSVVVAGTGLPARRARVSLSAPEAGGRTATTDEQGLFSFAKLPAGRYSLSASKPSHVNASYGQVRPGRPGTPIQLEDGQQFSTRLQIYKGGVLTGTILDEHGEAISNTQVRVMRYVTQTGQRTLQQNGGGSTDDRGIYRVFGLQPGEYIIAATPRNTGGPTEAERMQTEMQALQRMIDTRRDDETVTRDLTARIAMMRSQVPEQEDPSTGYAPVYFPGTTAPAQALTVPLAAGEEKAGVDFQLMRVLVARVEGTVVNGTGQPLQNIQVMLSSQNSAPGVDTMSARADAEGRFRLSNVAPGQYTILARSTANQGGRQGGPPQPMVAAQGRGGQPQQSADPMRYWASADVSVDGRNVSNVMLTLQPGMTITGRILFDGAAQPPADFTRLRVNLNPVDPGGNAQLAQSAAGRVDAAGRFSIPGVLPGKYRLTAANAGQGWAVESAIVEGQDTLDFPIEIKPGQTAPTAVITFSDRRADLSGTLLNERGQPAPEYTVVLYPTDPRYWIPGSRRIRTARPATDGRFQLGAIAPGDYQMAPVFDAEPGAWFDPAFLQQLDPVAVRVTITDGEKKVQNLKVSSAPR